MHEAVRRSLPELRALVQRLTDASNTVPHVRIDGQSLGMLAGNAANVYSNLSMALEYVDTMPEQQTLDVGGAP